MKPLACAVIAAGCIVSSEAAAGERFACNLKALTAAEHARHRALTAKLLDAVLGKIELPNGYGFRLDRALFPITAEWAELEAKCCPFFSIQIELEQKVGPLWLRLGGREGVKPFIRSEFHME